MNELQRFLKLFWSTAVSIATLVGLYLAFEAVHRTRLFWWVTGSALVIGLVPLGARHARDLKRFVRKARDYDKLLERTASLQVAEGDLLTKLEASEAAAAKNFEVGVTEGHKQILGAELSSSVNQMPVFLALSQEGGTTVLVAQSQGKNSIQMGTRFVIEVPGTGEINGAVEAVFVDGDLVHLACVERTVYEFWDYLDSRAAENAAPPVGVRLSRYSPPSARGQELSSTVQRRDRGQT